MASEDHLCYIGPMITLLFRAIFIYIIFYFVFSVFRGIIRSYKLVKAAQNGQMGKGKFSNAAGANSRKAKKDEKDTFEADYKVISED